MSAFDGFLRKYLEGDNGMAQLNARDKAAKKSDAPRGPHDYRGEDGRMDEGEEGSAPVADGLPSADESEDLSEAPGEFFPMSGGGDASGKMAYRNGRQGDGPGGFRDSGRRLAPESEDQADSRRGAASDGYPVDKSDPADAMDPGWNGDALDDQEPGAQHVRVECPSCGEPAKVRLPSHIRVRSGESEGSRIMRTRCAKCGEGVRFTAPAGHSFQSKTTEAAGFFASRYRYLTGRSSADPKRGRIRNSLEAFRESYWSK